MPTLHPFQQKDANLLVSYLLENDHVAAVYCTGAGKTLLSMVVSAKTMGEAWVPGNPRFSHVLIAAPTLVIREGFTSRVYQEDNGQSFITPEVRVEDDPSVNGLETYLRQDGGRYAVRMTHQKLAYLIPLIENRIRENPQFAIGKLLVIDEAHHSGENTELAKARDLWLSAGGKVLSLTATPDRSDPTTAIPENVVRVRRSMTEQMGEGFAPASLRSDVIPVEGKADRSSDDMMVPDIGDAAVARQFAELLTEDWLESCRPKTIVRLKNVGGVGAGKKHQTAFLALARQLKAAGARVFIASERHQEDPELQALNDAVLKSCRSVPSDIAETGDLTELLKYESLAQTQGYRASHVDVILGMQSVLEGMDWPICSHMCFVGIPRHTLPLVQGIGRAMRDRKSVLDYPSDWADASRVVFFASVDDEAKGRKAHAAQMLAVSCYLATFTQWSLTGALQGVFKAIEFESPGKEEEERRKVAALDIPEDVRAKVNQALHLAKELFESATLRLGRTPPRSQIVKMTERYIQARMPDFSVNNEVILRVLIFQDQAARREMVERTQQALAEGRTLSQAAEQALNQVLKKFEQQDYEPSPSEGTIQRILQTLKFDARLMDACAHEMALLMSRPSTPTRNVYLQAEEYLRS